jgi:dolichol-phosphate mannosyltransferase
MADLPHLSVVLPAYLEEENLRLLLPRITAAAGTTGPSFEVIVVDTVLPLDATETVARQHQARVIRRAPSNSFGDAVRTGIAQALGEIVIFMDADGSHGPEMIPLLVRELQNADVVIASRYVSGGRTENSAVSRAMSRILNRSYELVLGLDVRDVSNSFRAYRGDLLRSLLLRCDNFDIVEEILYKIRRTVPHARFKEVPAVFKKRLFGRTKRNLPLFVVTYLVTILRLRFFTR